MPETHYVLGVERLDLSDKKETYGLFSFIKNTENGGTVKLVSPLFDTLEELAEKYLAENLHEHPYVSFYKPHQFPDFAYFLEGYGPAVFYDKKSSDSQNKILKTIRAYFEKKRNTPKKRHNPPI